LSSQQEEGNFKVAEMLDTSRQTYFKIGVTNFTGACLEEGVVYRLAKMRMGGLQGWTITVGRNLLLVLGKP
jgi:hypothetical protein